MFDYSNINSVSDFWNIIAPSFQEYDKGIVWVASVVLKLLLFRWAGWIVSSLQAFWSVIWTIFTFFFTMRELQDNDISIYDFIVEKLRVKFKKQLANYEDFLLDDKRVPFVSGALITGVGMLFLAGVVWGIGLAAILGLLGNILGILETSFFRVLNIGALSGGFLLPIVVYGTDKLYNRIKGIDSPEGIVTEIINTVNIENAREEIIIVATDELEQLEKEEEIDNENVEYKNIKSTWRVIWDAILLYSKTTFEKVSRKTQNKWARFKQKFFIAGYAYNILLVVIIIIFTFIVK